jgi:hypothetical protein
MFSRKVILQEFFEKVYIKSVVYVRRSGENIHPLILSYVANVGR